MKQIERRYAGEWVLIVSPVFDRLTRVQRGEVVYHSTGRDEVWKVAHTRGDAHTAVLRIGRIPDDLVVVF